MSDVACADFETFTYFLSPTVIIVIIIISFLALILSIILNYSSCCPEYIQKQPRITAFDSINIHDSEMAIANSRAVTVADCNESVDSLDSLGGHETLTRTATEASQRSKISQSQSSRQPSTRSTKF